MLNEPPDTVNVTSFLMPADTVPNEVIAIVPEALVTNTVPSSFAPISVVVAAVTDAERVASSLRNVACICWKLGARPEPIVVADVGALLPSVVDQFFKLDATSAIVNPLQRHHGVNKKTHI
jgi:hypothetical protein